jgi:hypothetical protein
LARACARLHRAPGGKQLASVVEVSEYEACTTLKQVLENTPPTM